MEHKSTNSNTTSTASGDRSMRSGPSRRALVGAAAWSAPVIAVTIGTPAAAASGAWDLALDPPQLGDSATVYNADLSRRYSVSVPIAWVVANHGSEVSPAGFPFSITYDNRIWDITGMRARWNSSTGGGSNAETVLPLVSSVVDGNRTTATVDIPFAIPAGTDSYSGLWVALDRTFLAAYPNDAVDAPTSTVWEIQPPSGDADTSNNSVSYAGFVDEGPADVWGAVVEAQFERFDFDNGSYVYRPVSGTVTSTGPKPAVAGGFIRVQTDERASSSIDLTNIRLNGAPAGGAVVFDHVDTYYGLITYVYYRTTVDLVAGDVVTFDVTAVDGDRSIVATSLNGSQVAFDGVELNDPDRRAPELGFVNNNDRSPE